MDRKFKGPYQPPKNNLKDISVNPESLEILIEQEEDITSQIKQKINQKQEMFKSFGEMVDKDKSSPEKTKSKKVQRESPIKKL